MKQIDNCHHHFAYSRCFSIIKCMSVGQDSHALQYYRTETVILFIFILLHFINLLHYSNFLCIDVFCALTLPCVDKLPIMLSNLQLEQPSCFGKCKLDKFYCSHVNFITRRKCNLKIIPQKFRIQKKRKWQSSEISSVWLSAMEQLGKRACLPVTLLDTSPNSMFQQVSTVRFTVAIITLQYIKL